VTVSCPAGQVLTGISYGAPVCVPASGEYLITCVVNFGYTPYFVTIPFIGAESNSTAPGGQWIYTYGSIAGDNSTGSVDYANYGTGSATLLANQLEYGHATCPAEITPPPIPPAP
jgi:hypothetical protein